MEKLKQFGWILLILVVASIAKIGADHNFNHSEATKSNKIEKPLIESAKNMTLPYKQINGMKEVINNGELYLEFDSAFQASIDDSKYVLGDWISKDDTTSLRISFRPVSNSSPDVTFSTVTESERKQFIDMMKKMYDEYAKQNNSEITFLEDGYFKLNDNVIIYLYANLKTNVITQNAFYYYIFKNSKIYTLSYFTIDDDKPNDLILSSLNTLQIK